MNSVIKNILEIDKRAMQIKKEAEEIIELKDSELEKKLLLIEQDNLQKAKDRCNKEYQRIIGEGKKEAEEIIKRGENEIMSLEEDFNKKLVKIKGAIFEKIFTVND